MLPVRAASGVISLIPIVLVPVSLLTGCEPSMDDDDASEPVDHAPAVAIEAPGEILYPGDSPFTFRGQVTDEDLVDASLLLASWRLSRGVTEISTGSPVPSSTGSVELTVTYLEEGDYTLRLEAVDPTGLLNFDERTFSVRNSPPVLEILEPAEGVAIYQGQPFTVSARVTDEDLRGELFRASLLVGGQTHASDVSETDGSIAFEYTPPHPGELQLTVLALDELGAEARASFNVVVIECTDHDGDGISSCPSGELPGDCDDDNAEIGPGAPERCNGRDDDCDGALPPEEGDLDRDGVSSCRGDCDDADAQTHPGATEQCDGLDNNCDLTVPAEENDLDADGYRGCGVIGLADCDDLAATINPAALEICDGKDDNCDGVLPVEEQDTDRDGWPKCAGDCDDDNAYTLPGAVERLDLKDNDCDGVPEGVVRLSVAQARYEGVQADALSGSSLSAGGDVTGDGVGDLAIGAPKLNAAGGAGAQRGGVYLVTGRAQGWTSQEGVSLAATYLLSESESGALTGSAVSIVEDLNGDKIDDLVVGAPGHSYNNVTQAGMAYVLPGRKSWASGPIASSLLTLIEGTSSGMNLGASLSAAADFNGDGTREVAIGAPWPGRRTSATGLVALLSGRLFGWTARTNLNSLARIVGDEEVALGSALVAGSSTGDGYPELFAAGMGSTDALEGVVYWIPGSASIRAGTQVSTSSLNAKRYDGNTPSERIGATVGGGVDVDGDGRDDVLAGRATDGGTGDAAAYLLFGASSLPGSASIEQAASVRFLRGVGDFCPCTVAGIGDWDGDGIDDFAIGVARARDGGTDAGKVYLFLGRPDRASWPATVALEEADGIAIGESAGDQAGLTLAGGDLSGDGLADLIIGAPNATVRDATGASLSRAGRIYVILGSAR